MLTYKKVFFIHINITILDKYANPSIPQSEPQEFSTIQYYFSFKSPHPITLSACIPKGFPDA